MPHRVRGGAQCAPDIPCGGAQRLRQGIPVRPSCHRVGGPTRSSMRTPACLLGLVPSRRPLAAPPRAHGLRASPAVLPSSEFAQESYDGDEGTSSMPQAMMNTINILMGVGLLSVPYALKEGGWAALGVLALICASTNYTGKILSRCQEGKQIKIDRLLGEAGEDELRGVARQDLPQAASIPLVGKVLKSYEEIGEAAFGREGRQFITAVLYAELLGTCALFFILEADHLQLLLSSIPAFNLPIPPKEELMAFGAAAFLPTTWLPDLSSLSYMGAFGGLSTLGLVGVVLYEFFNGGIQIADTAAIHSTLPTAFGLLAFVFAGHAVFPSIYSSMKDRKQYPKMLDWSYGIVCMTCLAMGAAGYALYGASTFEEVTLNLPPGLPALLSTLFILVSPFTKFALTLEPVARGVDEKLNISMHGPTRLLARASRTGLGLGTLFLATKVPYFGQVMSVVGSFLTMTVSVIFPSLCYLKIFGDELTPAEKNLNYVIIVLGLGCATSGTWTAVHEVMKQLQG
eukprot:evm.model.scf_1095EXC.2 EVM.evm.TU.scf_1095EXC.2   scf_1095EXC:35340-43169(+)